MDRVSHMERTMIMRAAEKTTPDHLKRLPQETKKTLEKVRKNEKLTTKELNIAHHLTEKLEGRFDKYKVREEEHKPSTRGEKIVKGIKNLVGARISSKKLDKNLHKTAGRMQESIDKLPPRLNIEGLERAPRAKQKEVLNLKGIERDPIAKGIGKVLPELKLKGLKRAPLETEFQPRKMSSMKHTQNLMTLARNPNPETNQDQINEYLVKHKSFREMVGIGLQNPKFRQKAKDALRFAMDSRELNPTEQKEVQRLFQALGKDEMWTYAKSGNKGMLADHLVENKSFKDAIAIGGETGLRAPILNALVTAMGSKALSEVDKKEALKAYMQLKTDTRTHHEADLEHLIPSIGIKPMADNYREHALSLLLVGRPAQEVINRELVRDKCYYELADLATEKGKPEYREIARTAFMHAARNEQLPALERLLAFDLATNL